MQVISNVTIFGISTLRSECALEETPWHKACDNGCGVNEPKRRFCRTTPPDLLPLYHPGIDDRHLECAGRVKRAAYRWWQSFIQRACIRYADGQACNKRGRSKSKPVWSRRAGMRTP